MARARETEWCEEVRVCCEFSEFIVSCTTRQKMSDDSDVEAMLEAPFMKDGSEVRVASLPPPSWLVA